jgi:pseudouridine-5'-phosphate glycosidase
MKSKGITGHQITPFLLKRVSEKTGGKSLESNLALVAHNTKIATNIAKELSQLKSTQRQLAHEARRKPTTSYIVE